MIVSIGVGMSLVVVLLQCLQSRRQHRDLLAVAYQQQAATHHIIELLEHLDAVPAHPTPAPGPQDSLAQ
ncbi:Uncharacterized protein PBTT_08314 [Plasmodiophora brassicae]